MIKKGQVLILLTLIMKPAGIILAAIGVLVLVIRIIRENSNYGMPGILIVSGAALIIATRYFAKYAFEVYVKEQAQSRNQMVRDKGQYAKTDADGNRYFQIPEFSAIDNKGNVFDKQTLSQYKYTFVNVWEPWCGPCKQELDDLQKLYTDYKDRGINFVGFYNEEKDAADVITAHGISYPMIRLNKEEYKRILDPFQVGNIPLSFVLDREGKLVDVKMPEKDVLENAGPDTPEYIKRFARSISVGARDYEFWAKRFDTLLQDPAAFPLPAADNPKTAGKTEAAEPAAQTAETADPAG